MGYCIEESAEAGKRNRNTQTQKEGAEVGEETEIVRRKMSETQIVAIAMYGTVSMTELQLLYFNFL